jgi:20S proteasome alpha/beta subunit
MKSLLLFTILLYSYSSYSTNALTSGTNVLDLTESKPNSDDKSKNLKELFQNTITKTGTTIVGLCLRGGVILGADTRSTGGPLVMDKNKMKIHKIANQIYSCAAGTSADCDQITKEANHFISLSRLEFDTLEEDQSYLDPIPIALKSIRNSFLSSRGGSSDGEKKSSVMIVGGVDANGPSLYSVSEEGVSTKVSFAALGSGSTDAIAILENFIHHHRHHQTEEDTSDISIEEGVSAVREAVMAGILNDLGSGSHIDLCIIHAEVGAELWRELSKFTNQNSRNQPNEPLKLSDTIKKDKLLADDLIDSNNNDLRQIRRSSQQNSPTSRLIVSDIYFV